MTRNLDGMNREPLAPHPGVLPQAAIQMILDRLVEERYVDNEFRRSLKNEFGITLEDLALAAAWHAARAL